MNIIKFAIVLCFIGITSYSAFTPLPLPGASGIPLVSNGAKWTSSTAVSVAGGGTGLASGTSGGIPFFSTTTAITSSALLAAGQVMLGGGAGTTPATLAAGTAGQILMSNGSSAATWESAWYINAYFTGANPTVSTTDINTYTEIINAGLTLTPISGSAAVGTMCSTTNAATSPSTSTTTCAAGSESLGINFVTPTAGAYKVCAYFGNYMQASSGVQVFNTFQLIETPTNAQTLTLEGGTRLPSALTAITIATGTSHENTIPNSNCSIFNWTAATHGVRLMFESDVSGVVSNNLILCDENSGGGQRNCNFTVERLR